ncbi:MAG: hypothetical protein ABFR33_09160 [Verrucomicrobiota bacterium]
MKALTAVMALGLVILLGLHLFLQFGLTKTMRDVVLPRIEAETGIDVRVGRLSINLPGGILYLNDVVVKNPDGFLLENLASIDRVRLEIDLHSLLKKAPILVESIEVENALLNVVRNKDGEINLDQWLATPPPLVEPGPDVGQPSPEPPPSAERPAPEPEKAKPLPEVLVEALLCHAKVRYVDLKLDQLDIVLDLGVTGSSLSTQQDPSLPWGELFVIGSLGDKRTSFVTDLQVKLAPLSDPQAPSFDLSGKVLEIDPRLMEEAYSDLGIRSAPFGLDPQIHCREGWFRDSLVTLNITDIVLEDKLSDRLGGMASIGSLRFPVPVEGSLREPTVDVQQALYGAIGGNTQTLLESFLKGAAAKEAGSQETPETLTDAAVEVLGAHVDEIGESEAAKKALKDLVDGEPFATNAPSPVSSDVLIDILGEQVEEIGENEAVKDDLKNLGKWLFGK